MANPTYVGDEGPDGTVVKGKYGFTIADATSNKVAFYGTTPVSQRAAACQATSTVGTASSADVTTDLKATVLEIMNTLNALGIWKGSA